MPLNRRPVDLQLVCEEAMIEMRTRQSDAIVRLQAGGDLRGEWDPDRLTQVVSNLVGNAIQHGSGTPVTLTAHGDSDSVTLAVQNGGPPIPPDGLPFVFEPLARGPGQRAGHSIGLGLFIVRAIVSAHGGDIQVNDPLAQTRYELAYDGCSATLGLRSRTLDGTGLDIVVSDLGPPVFITDCSVRLDCVRPGCISRNRQDISTATISFGGVCRAAQDAHDAFDELVRLYKRCPNGGC